MLRNFDKVISGAARLVKRAIDQMRATYSFQGRASFIDVLDWDREMGQGRFGSAATAHPASPSLPF